MHDAVFFRCQEAFCDLQVRNDAFDIPSRSLGQKAQPAAQAAVYQPQAVVYVSKAAGPFRLVAIRV